MSFASDPIRREESVPVNPLTAEAVELAFRDACESAVLRASSLVLALRCFRSVISLAARLRVERADVGLPAVWEAPLLGLLDQVLIVAGEQLRAERMPVETRLRLYTLIAGLARAAQRARAGTKTRRQDPIRREDSPRSQEMVGSSPTMTDGVEEDSPRSQEMVGSSPTMTDGAEEDSPRSHEMVGSSPTMTDGGEEDSPFSREVVESGPAVTDGAEEPVPLSAWRADHTAQRDKLAHARLKFVLEDRVYAKALDDARRQIAEKAAVATAHAP